MRYLRHSARLLLEPTAKLNTCTGTWLFKPGIVVIWQDWRTQSPFSKPQIIWFCISSVSEIQGSLIIGPESNMRLCNIISCLFAEEAIGNYLDSRPWEVATVIADFMALRTRPSVNYAKDWLDHSFLFHAWSFLAWKSFILDVITRGHTSYLSQIPQKKNCPV